MTNPIDKEAAEILARIDQLSEDLQENFKKMNTLFDTLEFDHTVDTTSLDSGMNRMLELIEKNRIRVNQLRDKSV